MKMFYKMMCVFVLVLGGYGCDNNRHRNRHDRVSPVVDLVAPTLSSTGPTPDATQVALNTKVVARFSEAMDEGSISEAFSLSGPAGIVAGLISYDNVLHVAEFTPFEVLVANTVYVATVSQDARDLAGNNFVDSFIWSFTTVAVVGAGGPTIMDTIAPTLTFVFPISDTQDVALNSKLTARFSEPMISVSNFTLEGPAGSVAGTVSYDATNDVASFVPTVLLTADTVYTAMAGSGAKDLAGNALANPTTWSFKTGVVVDTDGPAVTSMTPDAGDVGVAQNTKVTAVFNEPLDTDTVTTTSFVLQLNGVDVVGVVESPGTGTSVVFTPDVSLAAVSTYTVTLTQMLTDLAGNTLVNEVTWAFQTNGSEALGPDPVNLGTAGSYVILAKSGVSTTGTTNIVGDVGLSPAAASFLTGFSLILDSTNQFSTSSIVTGKLFAADYAPPTPSKLTIAVLDMQAAYTDAAGRAIPDATEVGAGNLNGLVIEPGLYKWGTGVLISTNVTLDGGPNDTWILQIAGDLTVGNGATITLVGGALPKNIVWQVAGQTILGTTSSFNGVILCKTLIAFNTGSVLNGRVLAQTAVTLDAAGITQP